MKSSKNKSKTVKNILIVATMFSLQLNALFAANPIECNFADQFSTCKTCQNAINEISLAPITPDEATFSDEAVERKIEFAPTTPAEASFDDDAEPVSLPLNKCLAPQTPAEADFTD